jgi:hypothetical protein
MSGLTVLQSDSVLPAFAGFLIYALINAGVRDELTDIFCLKLLRI